MVYALVNPRPTQEGALGRTVPLLGIHLQSLLATLVARPFGELIWKSIHRFSRWFTYQTGQKS